MDSWRFTASDSSLLFPASNLSGLFTEKEASYHQILTGFRGALRFMGVENYKDFTLHSPRTGGLSDAANSGLCSSAELTRQGRWKAGSVMPDIFSHLKASRSLLVNSF